LSLPVILQGGIGFTVIVNVIGVPGQLTPPAVYVGVTVIVPEIGVVPVFVAVPLIGLPVPLAGKPIAGLLFVQDQELTFVPVRGMEKICP
jgi:hypothetical protein